MAKVTEAGRSQQEQPPSGRAGKTKTALIQVRSSEEWKERVSAYAEELGLDASSFMRLATSLVMKRLADLSVEGILRQD